MPGRTSSGGRRIRTVTRVEQWRLCAEPFCPELVLKPSRFCATHARGWEQWRRTPNGRARQAGYSTQRWRRMRAERLRHARGLCEIRGPDCTRTAVQVHHVDHCLPTDASFFDFDNLRASCAECHRRLSLAHRGKGGGGAR